MPDGFSSLQSLMCAQRLRLNVPGLSPILNRSSVNWKRLCCDFARGHNVAQAMGRLGIRSTGIDRSIDRRPHCIHRSSRTCSKPRDGARCMCQRQHHRNEVRRQIFEGHTCPVLDEHHADLTQRVMSGEYAARTTSILFTQTEFPGSLAAISLGSSLRTASDEAVNMSLGHPVGIS